MKSVILLVLYVRVFSSQTYMEKAKSALNSGKYSEALAMYDKAIDERRDNQHAYFLRGMLKDVMGRHQSAMTDYSLTLEIDPSFHKARLNRAQLYLKHGDLELSLEDYSYLQKHSNDICPNCQQKIDQILEIQTHVKTIDQLTDNNKFKEAFDLSSTLLTDIGNSIQLRKKRVAILESLNNQEQLIAELSILIQINPNDLASNIRLANTLFSQGKVNESDTLVKKCLSHDPENSQCKTLFKKCKKINKLLAELESGINQNKYKEVLANCKTLLKETDEQPYFKRLSDSYVCRAEQKGGDKDVALSHCTKAIRGDPDDIEARFSRAELYILKEMYDEAKTDFEEILRKDDKNSRASEGLERINKILKNLNKRDYYKILNVTRSATRQEIERSYRKLVRKYHPDHYKTEEDISMANKKLQEINAAHSVLTDDSKRKMYDDGIDPLDPEQQSAQNSHNSHGSPFDGGSFFNFFRGGGNPFGGGEGQGRHFRFTFG